MTKTQDIEIPERQQSAACLVENQPRVAISADRRLAPDAVSKMVVRNEPAKQRPRLGCAGLVRRGDAVLLGRRDKEPNRGLWVLPGGGVEFGESFATTLVRELLEET